MTIAGLCGLIIFVLLAVMLIAGVPIAVALAVSSICAILPVLNMGASVLTGAQRIFSGISVFSLLAIPFFISSHQCSGKYAFRSYFRLWYSGGFCHGFYYWTY